MERRAFLAVAGGAVATLSGCASGDDGSVPTRGATLTFDVPGIDAHQFRTELTCEGENVSPNLILTEVGSPIESLAVVMRDPDVGPEPAVHWTLWGLPATTESVPQGVAPDPRVTLTEAGGGEEPTVSQGENYRGEVGYAGPCPPEREEHVYEVSMYGLSEPLDVDPGAPPDEVTGALDDSDTVVGGPTTFTGTYGGE